MAVHSRDLHNIAGGDHCRPADASQAIFHFAGQSSAGAAVPLLLSLGDRPEAARLEIGSSGEAKSSVSLECSCTGQWHRACIRIDNIYIMLLLL